MGNTGQGLLKTEEYETRIKTLETEARLVTDKLVREEFEIAELKKGLRLAETELSIYREIDSITYEMIDVKAMLDRIMDLVVKTMDADAGTLYRFTDNGELVFEVVKGPVAEKSQGEKMKVCEGIAGWVARTEMPYVANAVVRALLIFSYFCNKSGKTPHDIPGIPSKAKRGIFCVSNEIKS